jgi:hypothetical protein
MREDGQAEARLPGPDKVPSLVTRLGGPSHSLCLMLQMWVWLAVTTLALTIYATARGRRVKGWEGISSTQRPSGISRSKALDLRGLNCRGSTYCAPQRLMTA